ncbi:MAG: hypothetical protein U1F42_01185 [Candidatus Competibacteraceae bacterium]
MGGSSWTFEVNSDNMTWTTTTNFTLDHELGQLSVDAGAGASPSVRSLVNWLMRWRWPAFGSPSVLLAPASGRD